MNDLSKLIASVLKDAISAMLPDIIKDIRQEERRRIMYEQNVMAHDLYTKKEMAKHFKVSERSIENWHKLLPEDLRPIQIGGNVRYSDEHVKFFESLTI